MASSPNNHHDYFDVDPINEFQPDAETAMREIATSNAAATASSALANEPEYSVKVSIEPNHEREVFEIKYDGQEIYKEHLSYNEKLAQLISKIDFNAEMKTSASDKKPSDSTESDDTKSGSADATASGSGGETASAKKFFQEMFERVKLSLDEVLVLLDCLTIARTDRLMSIEAGKEHLLSHGDDVKPFDVSDKTFNVILKKKNIEKAKYLLKKSLDKMTHDQDFINKIFHSELHQARQKWRIKKKGTQFFCDLSYRSVGCVNSLKANVELLRNNVATQTSLATLDQKEIAKQMQQQQHLTVIIPDELQDYAFIQVQIIQTTSDVAKTPASSATFDAKFSLFNVNNKSKSSHWHEQLDRAQNAIYCKEIYNQLLREIFDPNVGSQHIKPIITGNSIRIMITPECDLLVTLVHYSDEKASKDDDNDDATPRQHPKLSTNIPADYNFDNALLEYYLHCLLRKFFEQNFFHYDQRPVTSTYVFNSQVKLAGMAYANLGVDDEDALVGMPNNITRLLNKKRKINLLQLIKAKAEHLILRRAVMDILSSVSAEVNEPTVFVEPTAWNSSSATDLIVTISSCYYEALAKSSFYIMIKQDQVVVLNRFSNVSVTFTDNIEAMKSYFLDQCCFHQINLITALSQLFGWTVVGNSFTTELDKTHMSGIAIIVNDKYSKKIGIKVGPVNKVEVYVNQYVKKTNDLIEPLLRTNASLSNFTNLNIDWICIKDTYASVDLNAYPGSTTIQKFELLLADFSTSDCVDLP